MRFHNLEMAGFLSYESQSIDLSNLAYAAVVGANGSGKSTVVQAIGWALFGTYRVDGDSDSIINTLYDDCRVSLEFSVSGDDIWRVTRTKRRGKSVKMKLEYVDSDGAWVRFGDHTNASAQNQIAELLGMSESAWRSLVLMSNEDGGNRFVASGPLVRREIITELIPEAARWSEFLAKATEEKRSLDARINSSEAVVESAKQSIEDVKSRLADAEKTAALFDEDEARSKIEALNAELAASGKDSQYQVVQNKIASLKSERKGLEREFSAAMKALSNEGREVAGIAKSLKSAERDAEDAEAAVERGNKALAAIIDELDDINADVVDANETFSSVSDRLSAAVSARSSASAALDDARKRRQAIEDNGVGVCYVCRSDIDDERYNEIIDTNDAEIESAKTDMAIAERALKKAQKDHAEAKKSLDAASKRKSDADKSMSSLKASISSDNARAQRERERADVLAKELESLRTDDEIAEDIDNTTFDHENRLRAIDKEIEDAEGVLDSLETVDTREIKRKIADVEEQVKRHAEVLGSIKSYKETLRYQQSRLHEAEDDIIELRERREDIAFIYEASKSSGIPSMLIDGVLSEIEAEQNNILANLPGSENMVVEFRTQKALKNGGAKASLDIVVHDGTGGERLFESFSSGEKVRLTVSNMFAMAKVFGARHPGATGTIILDEPLGVLDIDVVPAFVDVLRSAINSGIADSVLVVTHDQQVIDALPQTIMVHKTPDRGSIIEVM